MAKGTTLDISPETAKEMPMVDLVYELLLQSPEPIYFRDLSKQIAEIKGLSEEEMLSHLAQLYTEINMDGRFICVGRSLWGLKERYTTEQSTDAAVAANVKDDEYPDYLEDEEDEAVDKIDADEVDDDELLPVDDEFADGDYPDARDEDDY